MKRSNKPLQKNAGDMVETSPNSPFSIRRVRSGLVVTLLGFALFILGARPDLFLLDRSEVIGFVQIAVFEVGLGLMCLGGYISLRAFWKKQTPTISADFGIRLVATGYVITVVSGMADVFGMGSHPLPGIPYFGIWQGIGVMIGQGITSIGFLLLIPWGSMVHKKTETTSSIKDRRS